MPELHDVANHFDDTSAYDGYTGAFAFYGQFNTFDETAISGSTERKRTLSVAPGTVLPTRKVIEIFSERWIIGNGNTDSIYDRAIRKAYWLKRADDLATVRTPAQLLSAAAGTAMYVNKAYLKDTVNGVTDSDYDPFWEVFAAEDEVIPKGSFISVDGAVLRVRTSHKELAGFRLAQSDELDSSTLKTLTVPSAQTYNPITDTYTGGTATVSAIVLDAYKLYRYATKADAKVNSGDLTAVVLAPVPTGQHVTLNSAQWRVAGVQPELDAYALHLVKV